MRVNSNRGFSLLETMVAVSVMSVAVLGAAGVFSIGLRQMTTAPGDLVATEKAGEAIETVFSARDSQVLTWSQIRNVAGASGSDGGVFLDGPQPIRTPGSDGLVNTAAGAIQPVESTVLPGPDQLLGTSDDITVTLRGWTRETQIRDVPGELNGNGVANLRSITVIIKYPVGTTTRTYTVTAYISTYA